MPPRVEKSDAPLADAARAIKAAHGLVVTAGAGMGVDSGLPDFRGPEGFWKAYPALQSEGIKFEQIANPMWFKRNPSLAWGFYGHRFNLYRDTTPHAGFGALLELVRSKPSKGFVYTSNVDGHFQRANFSEDAIAECHGSINHLQCTLDCRGETWSAPAKLDFQIDAATCRAIGELPRCPHCGAIARPNILMFGDYTWQPKRAKTQEAIFSNWLDIQDPKHLVVIELGAGTSIPTVRHFSEDLMRAGATLIRINPREPHGPAGTIEIATGALVALTALCGGSYAPRKADRCSVG